MNASFTKSRSICLILAFALLVFVDVSNDYAAVNTSSPAAPVRPAGRKPGPLTHVIQVRQLSADQAARGDPVRITGSVTDLPGYKNSFFLQDATGGISVDRTDAASVRAGDRVEVIGKTNPGLFAPSLMVDHVKVVGRGAAPPPMRVSYDDMVGGAQDSKWIEVHGVVRSARISKTFEDNVMILVVDLGGGSTRVILQDFAGIDASHLVDSTVSIRGVCTSNFNDKRQFVGLEMYVPEQRDLTILHASPNDPFASPVRPLRNALQFGQSQHRIKVAGTVTYLDRGHALYIQDGSDGIAVQVSAKAPITPGTRVEAVGFPAMGDYAPVLQDGILRIVGYAQPPQPLRVEAKDVIVPSKGMDDSLGDVAPYDGLLLQLRAKVVENHVQGDQRVWILRQNNAVFEAYLPIEDSDGRTDGIGNGTVVAFTGICRVHADSERTPISFSILLRSPRDIVVLQPAPWWTPPRALSLVAGLALSTLLVILWVIVLRNRVEQQTRMIRKSENQYRYLAAHDELTGLLNRRAILLVLEREIARARRENIAIAIVLCDLDHFKQVNDVYGHLGGDSALRRFASALSESMRTYDSAGRYGGEEFLLVLPGITATDVETRLARLHEAISNLVVRDQNVEFRITCSAGAFLFLGDENDIDQEAALVAADRALYQAKETGRNRLVLTQGTSQSDSLRSSRHPQHSSGW